VAVDYKEEAIKRSLGLLAEKPAELTPVTQNSLLAMVGQGLESARSFGNKATVPNFIPLIGGQGVGDLMIGQAPEEFENLSYGNMPFDMPYQGTGGYLPRVKPNRQTSLADTVFLGESLFPVGAAAKAGAKSAIKGATPKAQEMFEDTMRKTGLLREIAPSGPKGLESAPQSDIGFYSASEQAALNLQRKSGSGQSFLNDIKKQANVKPDEIKWIGLDSFLANKKNVTKQEVQDYVANNKVDVQEITLGGERPFDRNRLLELEYEYNNLKQHPIDDPSFGQEKYDELITLMNIKDKSSMTSLYMQAEQAEKRAQVAQRYGNKADAEKYFKEAEFLNTRAEKLELEGLGPSNPTKYDNYTLKGGENYREFLFTIPQKNGDRRYTTGHWDDENVLAHLRVNDRTDADGKKVLLVEEVQSDWHQAGKKEGYVTKDQRKKQLSIDHQKQQLRNNIYNIAARRKEYEREIDRSSGVDDPLSLYDNTKSYKSDKKWNDFKRQEKELDLELSKLDDQSISIEGPPDAPMKDNWYHLPLKRVLKLAADEGYDRVALTNGARQADRYDLSKQVESIKINNFNEENGIKTIEIQGKSPLDKRDQNSYKIMVDKNGVVKTGIYAAKQFEGQNINKIFGKEIADQILRADSKLLLSGLNFKIGGEGMNKYYDEIYPAFLKKYGKKWNATTGQTKVNTVRGVPPREPVTYIDITPEMRGDISKKGQPLFSAAPVAPVGGGLLSSQQEDKKNNYGLLF
jgi:hypothetical protein